MALARTLLYADAYSGLLSGPLAVVASSPISSILGIPSSILAVSGTLIFSYSGILAYLLHKEGPSKRSLWLSIGWNAFAGVCGGIGFVQLRNLTSYGKGIVALLVVGSLGVAGSALRVAISSGEKKE